MKNLLKYLKNYTGIAILAPLFKMLEATFELLVPIVIAKLIDVGIKTDNQPYVIKCGLILLLLTVVGYLFSITAQYFSAKAATSFGKELRNDLFKHIQSLSYNELDKIGSSTLITRMTSDINQIITGVNMFLRLFLRSPFIVIGAVIMAFTVDVKTSTVFLVVLPVLSIVVFYITYSSIPLHKRVQGKLDKVTLLTREELSGIRVIRAFNRQSIEEEEFSNATIDLMNSQLTVGRLSAFMNPITYIIVNIGIVTLIHYGAINVKIGYLSQGQVIALVNYMSQILIELVKLANLIITLTKALACANRVSEVFNTEASIKYASNANPNGNSGSVSLDDIDFIEFRNVSMSYVGSKEHSINDISFTASKGETIGIIGGTGSGKSTLVNLISRLYDATVGEVLINGNVVSDYTKSELRKNIAYVPQKSDLFKGTIAENLRLGNKNATEAKLRDAIRRAQAEEFVSQKEDDINFMVAQSGKNLSGGQRQRLCIARALVMDAPVLILDDSSSALDFATEAKLRAELKNGSENRITFIVSQRPSTIMHANQILVLDDGNLIGHGTHDELIKSCDLYHEICKTQFKDMEVEYE